MHAADTALALTTHDAGGLTEKVAIRDVVIASGAEPNVILRVAHTCCLFFERTEATSCAMVMKVSPFAFAYCSSCGRRAVVPSLLRISQITAAGFRPASAVMSSGQAPCSVLLPAQ